MVRGWTPSGVLGYDSILQRKMFRHDIGVRHDQGEDKFEVILSFLPLVKTIGTFVWNYKIELGFYQLTFFVCSSYFLSHSTIKNYW